MSYPAYKATGSRWIERVPANWTPLRAKHVLREVDDRTKTGEETLLSMRQHRGLVPHNEVSAKRIDARHLVGYKKARPDELVLNRMQAGNAMFFRNGRFGLVSPDYAVFRLLRDDNPNYLGYLFRSRPMCGLFRSESKGLGTGTSGFLRLYSDRFAALPMALPSRLEQDQIVAYLRAQEAHIARLIKAKRDLLALLMEQRLRVIDDAVMNGLNRSVDRKSSGIAWLEDLPAHWSAVRLRTLTSSITSGSRGWSDHAADSGPVFLRVGNLSRGTLDLKLAKTIRLNLPEGTRAEASRTRVQEGDILLSITAYIGSVGLVPSNMEEAYVSQHVARCRLRPNIANPKWVAYVLLSRVGQAHGAVCMYGGTKQGLSLSDVKNHVVLLPPPVEQDELVRHIERETPVVDSLIAAARLEVEQLREYRERLISDAVTGQIDVRAWRPGPEDQITEEDLTALGDDDDHDTTEEETDGED